MKTAPLFDQNDHGGTAGVSPFPGNSFARTLNPCVKAPNRSFNLMSRHASPPESATPHHTHVQLPSSRSPLLAVKGLRKHFGGQVVLDGIDLELRQGEVVLLRGENGSGKTTLLNIISGLLQPSEGRVLFDGRDVTRLAPAQRNIAQVFQFPVIYDTMTVAENLAFPLKNRKVPEAQIKQRVGQIAEMLEMSHQLDMRAAGLSADQKQKISLGRGLVRSDVAAVLFDEPLTVIDPHLKWQLRRKLKQIHHELKLTLIYVTHDQVEALTFADKVVVMSRGRVMQLGTPDALFEKPAHTFVGHFIGSPGMNFLPAVVDGATLQVAGQRMALPARSLPAGALQVGVRPEYLALSAPQAAGALQCRVAQVQDIGTYQMLTAQVGDHTLKARVAPEVALPAVGDSIWLQVLGEHTCFYQNEELLA